MKNIPEKHILTFDVERHLKEKERLNQALNGNLSGFENDIKEVLKKYNIDLCNGIAFDSFIYVLEQIHIEKFNIKLVFAN
ncbi:hypothetical protein [Acetivibrio ethanolgignens]|uniref:Uncharacterized protein n=1 Tax=Acetivibrio ethanolgignens TaxID=290052 RepID=A0A0V8QII5_9FIRM|nr:hypothetical protein [Acetivibrio ethanolgignens]KSV60286.1 hypothetical protein ASU35_05905 [Acetivibrio ethanolgignens]